jgi:hypothetical protein
MPGAGRRPFRRGWTGWTRRFLFERSIDIDVYDLDAEKLRQELTLLRIERHAAEIDELDVGASWPSSSVSCRGQPTSGFRRPSTRGSGSNSCSFHKEPCSTGPDLLEPP